MRSRFSAACIWDDLKRLSRVSRQLARVGITVFMIVVVGLFLTGSDAYAARRTVKSIKITNASSEQGMVVKKGFRLKVKTKPHVSTKRLSFRSSNRRIATVTQRGYIRARKTGTVYITVRSNDKKRRKARIKLRVYKPAKSIKINSSLGHPYIQRGSQTKLTCKVSPAKACQKAKWSSSDKRIATVDSKGQVTAHANGKVTITARVADRVGKKAKYTLTVGTLSGVASQSIGHRGYSSIAPENTRAAFQLGVNAHFGGLECDVRRTEDGRFVLSHDSNLLRIFGDDHTVAESEYSEIRDLRAVGGKGVNNYPNEKLLTLEEYMEILKASNKKAVIELKVTWSLDIAKELYDLISSYGINDRVEIISFSGTELLRIKEAAETYKDRHETEAPVTPKMYYLTDSPTSISAALGNKTPIQWALDNDMSLSITWRQITADIVNQIHAAGKPVTAWTVDQFDAAYYLTYVLGVDRITSNVDLFGN